MSGVPDAPPHLPPSLGSVPPLLESFPVSISDVLGPAAFGLLHQNKLKTVGETRGKSGPGRSPGCSGFPLL